jgi:(heptosyl)LPS beta-1,4-glucosyltransferase
MRLTAIILTYNEAQHIAACIESARFADAILVFDSFSTDATVDLARGAGAQVLQRRFDDYAGQRNAALAAAESEWVLFVDADERVTPELAAEVRVKIALPGYSGWRIPRHNYIFGRRTRGGGWYPDYQTRLLKVGEAQYDPLRRVHETVILERGCGTLENAFIHYNYATVHQFHEKQRRYSAYDAEILFQQGTRPKPQNYVLQPIRQFWWRFVTLKGYVDGLHGLRLCLLMAWYEFRKYVRLRRLWQPQQSSPHS